MAYEDMSGGGLNYFPCRYGQSRLLFRGPRQKLDGKYIAVLGSSETYGKFVTNPFCDQLQSMLKLPVVNFGCMYAGVGVFSEDRAIQDACSGAELTIIQVMSAQNMSNRFYSVHPRRNDRFLKASEALRGLYPETDFTDYNFTLHLLASLRQQSAESFAEVEAELRAAWLARMRALINRIESPVALLWVADRRPDEPSSGEGAVGPCFVDGTLLSELSSEIVDVIEVLASDDALNEGLDDKVFAQMEAPAASELPGPRLHTETAQALARAVPELLSLSVSGGPDKLTGPLFRSGRRQSLSVNSGTAEKRSATRP